MTMTQVLLAIAVGFVTSQLALFATTIYLHRCVTHRAIDLRPVAAILLRFFLWVTTGIRTVEWAGVHRRHHAALDTPDDPHSPAIRGFWHVQLLNIVMYHQAAHDRAQVARYTRDLHKDSLDRLFDRETLGPLIGLGSLCLVFGWKVGLLAGLLHLVFYVGLNGVINAVGHTAGTRPNDNSATNGRLVALLTAGEGLHNNHHAAPTAARFSHAPRQWDPAWWCIRALDVGRMVSLRHPGGLLPATVAGRV